MAVIYISQVYRDLFAISPRFEFQDFSQNTLFKPVRQLQTIDDQSASARVIEEGAGGDGGFLVCSALRAATIRAEFDMIPVSLPLFPPRERPAAYDADFGWEFFFLCAMTP